MGLTRPEDTSTSAQATDFLSSPEALENMPPSELIQMDKTYLSRLNLRKQILREHPDKTTVAASKRIEPAVKEFYNWIMEYYLPTRFPTMFKIIDMEFADGRVNMLRNQVTNEVYPVQPSSTAPLTQALTVLGKTVDEDLLFLLPSENFEKDQSYVLEGYVCCFPNGFDLTEKYGKKLRDIHAPVPGYEQKLRGSMDRFFDKIEVGKFVRRWNWSVDQGQGLYAPFGDQHGVAGVETKQKDIDVDNVRRHHSSNENEVLYYHKQVSTFLMLC